jgi:osmoprotectant transport system permease protein
VSFLEALGAWFAAPQAWSGPDSVPNRLTEHIGYSLLATVVAALIALPLGLWIGHTGRFAFLAINSSAAARALPTLGLVVLVYRLAPLSVWPVLAALVALAVPPIITNTYAGVRAVDERTRDAAIGMGMTGWQALWRVEVPLALPLVIAGIRSAALQVVATATIAAYAGLGGIGRYIIDGFALRDTSKIAAGAVLVAALALVAEGLFALVQRALVPHLRPTRAGKRADSEPALAD